MTLGIRVQGVGFRDRDWRSDVAAHQLLLCTTPRNSAWMGRPLPIFQSPTWSSTPSLAFAGMGACARYPFELPSGSRMGANSARNSSCGPCFGFCTVRVGIIHLHVNSKLKWQQRCFRFRNLLNLTCCRVHAETCALRHGLLGFHA